MASLWTTFVIVASIFHCHADEPRPTIEDWKEGEAAKKQELEAVDAKQAKMAAVDKVVTMLADLQNQIVDEGMREAQTYNKFACFCKTTQSDKTDAIQTGKDDKADLSAQIQKLSNERDQLDTHISGLQRQIEEAEGKIKRATDTNKQDAKVYSTNEVDMQGAIQALQEAIKVLKASKTPSLVQLQSISQTVKQATLMADALGIGGELAQQAASFFIQQDAKDVPVEMEDYKFHSDSIVQTLENLLGEFRKKKADIDADEVRRVQEYKVLLQNENDVIKAKNLEMAGAAKERSQKIEDIGTASQELSTVSATLLDDMEYLDELNTMCSQKATTWEQRSRVRADELTTLTQAIGIIKSTVSDKTQAATIRFNQGKVTLRFADAVANDEEAMQAIEAEAEAAEDGSGPLGFLQKKMQKPGALLATNATVKTHAQESAVQKHAQTPEDASRALIVSLLRGQGQKLQSTLLTALATRIAADPFAKVKQLIGELIERLLSEAANEASQKAWCDKATADATQKRKYSALEVESLDARMGKLEAHSAKLHEEIGVLATQISDLNKGRRDAEKERSAESLENSEAVQEARAGLDAVEEAIDILDKWYKTASKESVDLKLVQKGPADDAPATDFKTGEAYKGSQAESGGIIGMLEVISSDFVRTIEETQKAEVAAKNEHLQFMTETGKSLAEKTTAKQEKMKLKDESDSKLDDTSDALDGQMKILTGTIKELIELKATCIDTGMSYADRVARREEEIAALKKALCILNAYAEYGPDSLGDAC